MQPRASPTDTVTYTIYYLSSPPDETDDDAPPLLLYKKKKKADDIGFISKLEYELRVHMTMIIMDDV